MTDRFHTLTVVLERDTRDDDCQGLIDAIRHMRGVADVTGHVANFETHMAETRARRALGNAVIEAVGLVVEGKRA